MNIAAMIFALAAGGLVALQFGVNAALRSYSGGAHPLYATLVSYAIGTITSIVCLLAVRPRLPALGRIAEVPWWAWTGGAVGVGYVSASIVLAPRLGATRLIVLAIAGQLVASILFDHFGWIGYEVRPVNLWRAVGCVLLFIAMVIIKMN